MARDTSSRRHFAAIMASTVNAVIAALSGRKTKPRAVVGKGAGAFMMMSRLPIRLRDRLVRSALGLSQALKPAT